MSKNTMSVVLGCHFGYLLNHEEVITSSCAPLPFECRPCIFSTIEPYIKVAPSTDNSSSAITNQEDSPIRKKKKRKRKHSLNVGEISALQYHEKVKEKIKNGLEVLSKLTQWGNYFNPCNSQEKKETVSFLQAAFDCCEILSVVNKIFTKNDLTLFPVEHIEYETADVVNRIVNNKKDTSMLLSFSGAKYILPAHCQFLLSDISQLKPLIENLDSTYDLIVIDPPWENKSVKRGSNEAIHEFSTLSFQRCSYNLKKSTRYSSLPLWEIKKLPICDLASNMAFVAVWVTNKQKYRKFVLEELFPSWSCAFVGEWHWIKLTKRGEMIHDLESNHKKPYEPLLIGQFNDVQCCSNDRPVADSRGSYNQKLNLIPEHQIICSVPCSLHSRKPPLNDIFLKYLPNNAKCLELFARSLLPNWTSWGNEVLKYQHLDYFQGRDT